jgi:hypothetical protein
MRQAIGWSLELRHQIKARQGDAQTIRASFGGFCLPLAWCKTADASHKRRDGMVVGMRSELRDRLLTDITLGVQIVMTWSPRHPRQSIAH